MNCCGGKRTQLRSSFQTSPSPTPGTAANRHSSPEITVSPAPLMPAPAQAGAGTLTLRYLAGAPIQVIGPATRAIYRFTPESPLQRIARADAQALLASGYFRLEY